MTVTGTIFIPDIHGRFDLLKLLWRKLELWGFSFSKGHKVIFGGDMIDRGPDSKSVIGFIRELTEIFRGQAIALKGNHEALAIKARRSVPEGSPAFIELTYGRRQYSSDQMNLWYFNGGEETERSFEGNQLPIGLVTWLDSLPLFHEESGFFFSHAPVPPEHRRPIIRRGQPFTEEELTWTYGTNDEDISRVFDGKIGVCGHIHRLDQNIMAPRFYHHYIFADSGCGCSEEAPLVAVDVESRKTLFAWPTELADPQLFDARTIPAV